MLSFHWNDTHTAQSTHLHIKIIPENPRILQYLLVSLLCAVFSSFLCRSWTFYGDLIQRLNNGLTSRNCTFAFVMCGHKSSFVTCSVDQMTAVHPSWSWHLLRDLFWRLWKHREDIVESWGGLGKVARCVLSGSGALFLLFFTTPVVFLWLYAIVLSMTR